MIGRTLTELEVGDHAELVQVVGESQIAAFVDAVGDHNPLHSDPAFAATTRFKEPIAPGIFTAGMISAVIGTRLPGPGAVYLSQDLRFVKPVKAGDTITARVEIVEIVRERNRIRLATTCANQHGEEVLAGEAWVLPSRESIRYEQRLPGAGTALAAGMLLPWIWAARSTLLCGLFGLRALSGLCDGGEARA